ncbi:MAG TPA: glycosyltransferase [Gaiellaceae bacterium]|nr:glycosyltransferase [Gaiellaceae bacterium]
MPGVVHVVTTGSFAGVERYVCTTATELAGRGWEVAVVGGGACSMSASLGSRVRWLPGATAGEAVRSLARLGKQDICHVHMTIAEAVGVAARPLHRAAVISTRHFAARRGSTPVARVLAPLISAGLTREIAISEFVARNIGHRPNAVILNGVPASPCLWRPSSRVVLVLARLDPEKDTLTALRAWQASQLWTDGWSMRIVGDGSQRQVLEAWAKLQRLQEVVFAGWSSDVSSELARAGMLLAPAPREPFGLGVVEAMAAGAPVVACAGGGHTETVGLLRQPPMFPPGDDEAAAAALRELLPDEARHAASAAGRSLVEARFTVTRHVDRLLDEYDAARFTRTGGRAALRAPARRDRGASAAHVDGFLRELVVCSLEPWDEVWRRNQFFTEILLQRNPDLHVLFVEPPVDPLFELSRRRRPSLPRFRSITPDRRLVAFRPLKPFPRRLGPQTDWSLRAQVRLAARLSGFSEPTLWINDLTYAPLIGSTRWPAVYDVTDDWLAAPFPHRELERLQGLEETALEHARAVVVCSPSLEASRGRVRPVVLVPNGVDAEHFRRPRPRPVDLPQAPAAVYVGSLHESRIDIGLVVDLARSLRSVRFVFVGPISLGPEALRQLVAEPNVALLGSRTYDDVPGYLQHADVIIVPHLVNEFTESLDPIKAYECLALKTPTVATAVAGFRNYQTELNVVEREAFATRVADVLAEPTSRSHELEPPAWQERAIAFERVLAQAAARPQSPRRPTDPREIDPRPGRQ